MFSRLLLSTVAAASLAAAFPVLAGDDSEKDAKTREVPACCQRMAQLHHRDLIDAKAQQPAAASERKATPQFEEVDPNVRNQSWGG